jgi:hypothetical protein
MHRNHASFVYLWIERQLDTQIDVFLDLTDVLAFGLRWADIASTVQQPELVLYLHICYWHAANAMNLLIMKLHKGIMVPD